jgi:hypothetical protein
MYADAHFGAAGVTVTQGFLALISINWVEISTNHRIKMSLWMGAAVATVLYSVNDYLLVWRGSGVAFEEQFKSFSKTKKITLYTVAAAIVVAVWILFFVTASVYQETFHIVGPH